MGLLRCFLLSALVAGTGCRQVLGLDDVDCTPAYAAAVDYATGAGPRAVGAGELTGDGRLDLVTMNSGDNNVSRFYGLGDGTVMPKADHAGIAAPIDLAVGDVTGDGIADVAVLGNNAGLAVMSGQDMVASYEEVDAGRDLEIADLDGNGVMDLVATSNGRTLPTTPAKVSILLAQSDGTLALTSFDAPDDPNLIRIADFTSDGKLDLFLTSHDEIPTIILPGNGDGTFGTAIETGNQLTTSNIVVGDVNSDGRPDLVLTNTNTPATMMSVALGNGDGTFTGSAATAEELIPTGLTDVDGDGYLDLVGFTAATQDGSVMASIGVRLGAGDGTFGTLTATMLSGQPVDAIAAKLDGDSIPELVAVLGASNNIAIVDGRCSFAAE